MQSMHRKAWLLLSFSLATSMLLAVVSLTAASRPPEPPAAQAPAWLPSRFDPRLLKSVLGAGPTQFFDVVVVLRAEFALPAAGGRRQSAGVVRALQAQARSAQAPVLAQVDSLRAQGHVQDARAFWIFDGLALRADRAALLALAARDDIALIRADAVLAQAASQGAWNARAWTVPAERAALLSPATAEPWNLAAVRADLARGAFGVDGRGVVVGNMSSGVDWRHPALTAKYRGYQPGQPLQNTGNWADMTPMGYSEPTDDLGAGTHTMGTLAGDGVGVAPGVQWIAVKVYTADGLALESWLHAGFEWMLAPAGDPSRAPDIVVTGWSIADGGNVDFLPDVQALHAAGIFALYSTGDSGPAAGSVGAPGSYTQSFAVGSSDPQDEVTNFSGRGPSPWGDIRPDIVAPGAYVSSTVPGGGYNAVSNSATAPPHAAGVAALLLELDPSLSVDRLAQVLRSTARPLGPARPNNAAGWGLLDAYAAAATVQAHGTLRGQARDALGALPGAAISAVSRQKPLGASTLADAAGAYELWLPAGAYTLTAAAFGHTTWGAAVTVTTGTTQTLDLTLVRLPTGRVQGRLYEPGPAAQAVTGTVHAGGTPLTVTTGSAGRYAIDLPAGVYSLRARSLGHRPGTSAPLTVTPGQTITHDFVLSPTASILLVDSSAWYYGSTYTYFRTALDGLDYVYDEQRVKIIPRDVPSLAQLQQYDLVMWSSPFDSPGYVGAGDVLSGYLRSGGTLFLTGQDVGFWDGGLNGYISSAYYTDLLGARVLQDDVMTRTVTALPGEPFAGITVTLNGPDSANDQYYPDLVLAADRDTGAPVATYADFGQAALRANECVAFRSLYMAYGFEGIAGTANRLEILRRAVDWLYTPQPQRAIEMRAEWEPLSGLPGTTVTHALRVRNLGVFSESLALAVSGAQWNTALSTSTLALGSCVSQTVGVSVQIPPGAGWDARDQAQVRAAATGVSGTIDLVSKAPAPVLYVDHDRFYEEDRLYRAALRAAGVPYDYWLVGWNYEPGQGSPTASTLRMYPTVLWSSGYDWYQPLSPDEENTLGTYLDGGGRLLFSSQGYAATTPFGRERLGILGLNQAVSTTLVRAADALPVGTPDRAYALDYPFLNWSVSLLPYAWAQPAFYNQGGYPAALSVARGGAKTLYYAFPLETLRPADRADVLGRSLAWLSALGASDIRADRGSAWTWDEVTYTLSLRNDGPVPLQDVHAVNALPPELIFEPGTLVGPGQYDPLTGQVTWSGALAPGEEVRTDYRARIDPRAVFGDAIVNPLRVTDEQLVPLARQAVVRVGTPDLSPSSVSADPARIQPGGSSTVTLVLRNAGAGEAWSTAVTATVPLSLTIVPGTLWASSGAVVATRAGVAWSGDVQRAAPVTVRFALQAGERLDEGVYAVGVLLDDRLGNVVVRTALIPSGPFTQWFPAARK